jgi:uncharacterized phiE125 gp8 family phage protein
VIRTLTKLTESGIESLMLDRFLLAARVTNGVEVPRCLDVLREAAATFQLQTGRALLTQTYRLTLDEWPAAGVIGLGRAPVSAITSVKYYNESDVLTTVSNTLYALLEPEASAAVVYLRDDFDWPALSDLPNAVQVEFTAGHASIDLIPADQLSAVIQLAVQSFEHSNPLITGTIVAEVPGGVRALLAQNRIGGFIG